MKSIIKILGVLLMITILSSCDKEKEVDAYGNFEDDAMLISAEGAGRIIDFSVSEGNKIEKDQIIAIIDTMPIHLKKQVLFARKSIIDSKVQNVLAQKSVFYKQLENLKTNLDRLQKMYTDGAATQKQLDDIKTEVAVVNRKIKNISIQSQSVVVEKKGIDAQLLELNNLIKNNLIKSPITGTVLETFVKKDEFTLPGRALCSLQNIDYLSLRAYVSEPQLAQIKPNQKVKVVIDFGSESKTKEGTIYWISSKAEFTPKQIQTKDERKNLVYAFKVKVDNKGGLYKIGMPANIIF